MADDRTGAIEAGHGLTVDGWVRCWLHGLPEDQIGYIMGRLLEYIECTTLDEREEWRGAATELWFDAHKGEKTAMIHRVAGHFGKLVDGWLTADSAEGHEVWVLAHGLAMLKEQNEERSAR